MVQLTWIGDTDGNTDLASKGFPVNEIDEDGRLEGTAVLDTEAGSSQRSVITCCITCFNLA